jgi:senataxin
LIFAFDKQSQGKWGDELADRLNHILKYCPECVFNWHMKRKDVLQQFQE